MANLVLRKCGTLFMACSMAFLSPSCRNESDLVLSQIPTEGEMTILVDKVANSTTYQSLFTEMANMSALVTNKQLTIKPIAVNELQNKLMSSSNVGELEINLARNFSNPSLVVGKMEKIDSILTQLDAETHFSNLSTEKRKELMGRVFDHPASKTAFALAFKANDGKARMRVNCGGNCNNVYYHAIEYAGYACILATVASFAVGLIGGPAGMAAGALGIAAAAGGYLIAESAALTSLGDCFDACQL